MLSKSMSLATLDSIANQPPVKRDSSLPKQLFGAKICSVNLRNFVLHSSNDHFLVPRPNAQIPPDSCQTHILWTITEDMLSLPILLPTMRSKKVDMCTVSRSPI